ncbi:MAG TPA: SsrA-binding protein SmpB [Gemmatimonadales bacterium]
MTYLPILAQLMSEKSRPTDPKARISVARNPRASHDYHLLEQWEAGIVLSGTEVKSLRNGKASIKEAYALLRNGEVWLEGMHITPYEQGNRWNPEPVRARKLLMHRREIERLIGGVEQKGFTLVPLEIYFSRGRVKVAIALARGKKTHDRREDIKRRIADREMARAIKSNR